MYNLWLNKDDIFQNKKHTMVWNPNEIHVMHKNLKHIFCKH